MCLKSWNMFLEMVENIEGNGENPDYQRVVNTQDCLGKD